MNTLRFRLVSVLAAALLSGASSVSSADEALAAGNAARSASTQSQRTPNASDSNASAHKLVCLNMALQCFALKPAPGSGATKSSLDLRAPEIRRLVSEAELQRPLQDEYEQREQQEQVEVEGMRPEVYVPGGIASLGWAVMNPTQAWRIFLPVPGS